MAVIYVQFRARLDAGAQGEVSLAQIADILPPDEKLGGIAFSIPTGGRKISGLEVAARICEIKPDTRIDIVGRGDIFVARRMQRSVIATLALRVLLLALLFCGAALAITFFHADVNMIDAQRTLCFMLGGVELSDIELAIPYAIGVLAGVGAFFLLGGRQQSPLALKMQDYRKQLEDSAEK